MLNKIILFFLENKVVTLLLLIILIAWGIITSPFGWYKDILPSNPVAVDAIPDIGENQQIVYTEWPGRSPQDIDDQITYPLTTALLGIPGVKTVRSNSIFGFSSIYIIFEENIDYYWSRTRILEKLNSLPASILPPGVVPSLGPDATALGQLFWYTLEGRDKRGNPSGGWDPHELRTIQDFHIKYALTSVSGVAEVASIGGYIKEYQIDINPNAMKAHNVSVDQIMDAVRKSNLDIGIRTIEFNRAEYLIRAIGYIKSLEDLENSVISTISNIPIRMKDVAKIHFGPATRRGGLDKGGTEAVGGVVVARYGANPMEVINKVKAKIKEISPGLPGKILADGSLSKVTIVPFYDRSGLIKETLGTLREALTFEVLISIIVVIILILNLRASFLVSSLLPIGVLMTFIFMRQFNIDANIVALSGIAIAIGVMVDVGIVVTENIIRHTELAQNKNVKGTAYIKLVYTATSEIAPAVITAISTTIISFLPIFTMEAAEGKLFKPLAFTKTFAMVSALIIGLAIIPTLAHLIFSIRLDKKKFIRIINILLLMAGILFLIINQSIIALSLSLIGINNLLEPRWKDDKKVAVKFINIAIALAGLIYFLSDEWMPLGVQNSAIINFLFICFVIAFILGILMGIIYFYPRLLTWFLANKSKFLSIPVTVVFLGILIWQGFDTLFGFIPDAMRHTQTWRTINNVFPGIGEEFMPALDEGSFLLMPTTMPHSGIEENLDVIRLLDQRVNAIPEVADVVGKWGRINSALDPAPVSMFENVINYKPEYILNEDGFRIRFKVNKDDAFELKNGETYHPKRDGFKLIDEKDLIQDKNGRYFRQWRDHIKSPDDIWDEIIKQLNIPGLTSAPKLQPIQTRLVMLQTGMRSQMGIKVFGPDLPTIEKVGFELENHLKHVDGVDPRSVFADRMVGKPYIEIKIKRNAIARYGLTVADFQSQLSSALGGMTLTYTVEGRERFPVRVRYAREYRDSPDNLKNVLIHTPAATEVPLIELADIEYTRGPQSIKSENTFLVGYVIFDKREGYPEVDVIENAKEFLNNKIEQGSFTIPDGVSYVFTGNYENQVRAKKHLMVIIPVVLIIIFLILYFQFRSVTMSGLIFTGVLVAFSGGFILLWLYGQPWFMSFSIFGTQMRDLFQIDTVNLSVAVWVGFISLFGIATDDGVLISTYLKQLFSQRKPVSVAEIRDTVVEAGKKRIRPAMMTTATTIIALIPVLSSTGKGADIMVPIAIPTVGGMLIALMTVFIVPVCFSMWQESKIKKITKG